jgi:pimeloyl-ACP methyl ester carboxylesterase
MIFGHNPEAYASSVNCPALLMYGAKDKNVGSEEIDAIYANFNGPKQLKVYANAGHENYLIKYKNDWQKVVQDFLSSAK